MLALGRRLQQEGRDDGQQVHEEGTRWLQRAADQGHLSAAAALAKQYAAEGSARALLALTADCSRRIFRFSSKWSWRS